MKNYEEIQKREEIQKPVLIASQEQMHLTGFLPGIVYKFEDKYFRMRTGGTFIVTLDGVFSEWAFKNITDVINF